LDEDAYLALLLQGLVVRADMASSSELVLTFSPHRRVIIAVDHDGDLVFAEEDIPIC
jgi:hypothetical protein